MDPARTKSTGNWTCTWGTEEDAKLLIGVWQHGHGNWEAIRDDPALGLSSKIFLEESKVKEDAGEKQERSTPSAVHLVRRTDYLTHLLHAHETGEGGDEEKKVKVKVPRVKTEKAVGGPSKKVKIEKSGEPSKKVKAVKKDPKPDETVKKSVKKLATVKREETPEEESDSGGESVDDDACKEILRPVRKELRKLQEGTDGMSNSEKVTLYRECLTKIGAEIANVAQRESTSSARAKRIEHLCKSSMSLTLASLIADSHVSQNPREILRTLLAVLRQMVCSA